MVYKSLKGKVIRMNNGKQSKLSREVESIPLNRLILKYSIPAILSGLVGALYNIVDQIFIGNICGVLGNAATNVAFPLVTTTTAIALLFGIGGTANFSLAIGKGKIEEAKKFAGTVSLFVPLCGVIICILVQLFTTPLLNAFGATEANFELAYTYLKIVSLGYPFSMAASGLTQIIRADGSPRFSMVCIMVGAVLNCALNPILMITFNMGIAGAGWATVISQAISFSMMVWYLCHFKTFKITLNMLKPDPAIIKRVFILGIAPMVNQLSMTVTQVVLNNSLVYYGALSAYGSDIPLACAGIITKVNTIYMTIMVGIAQGTQPIIGYNFGKKNYDKVRECYLKNIKFGSIFSVLVFIAFQVFPQQIISLFGDGSPEYFEFATMYFKIFLFMTFLNGIQPMTGNFFTSIGKGFKGAIVSFTRQILFMSPLILILPIFFGIDGILYAGPIADTLAFILSVSFVVVEFKILKRMESEHKLQSGLNK